MIRGGAMLFQPEDLLKILLAVAAGGLIGMEREFRDKAAGFRTLIFICVGAALFTILSAALAPTSDPNRIASSIVTGVGFLGAGVILREGGRVIGLTTASTIWLTAAIGMALGGGQYLLAGVVVAVVMAVLWFFPKVEHWIDNIREDRSYEVVCSLQTNKFIELEEMFRSCGLKIRTHRQTKSGDTMVCTWSASGSLQAHEQVMSRLFADEQVKEFRF
jgi:putative Mg2+ transporter-C (MgtC) family protein